MALYGYTPEKGFWWAETLLHYSEFSTIADQYGQAGICYVFAFDYPHSPFSVELNLEEREKMVFAEIQDRKLQSGRGSGKIPPGFYQTKEFRKAADKMVDIGSVPHAARKKKLEERERYYEEQLSAGAFERDAGKREKQIDADLAVFKALDVVRKQIREEEAHINRLISRTGQISLSDLMEE